MKCSLMIAHRNFLQTEHILFIFFDFSLFKLNYLKFSSLIMWAEFCDEIH